MNLQDLWMKLKTALNNPGQQNAQTQQGQQVQQSGRPTSMQDMLQQLMAGRQAQGQAVQQQQQAAQAAGSMLQGANPGMQAFSQNIQGAMQGAQNFGQQAMQNPMIQRLMQMFQVGR